MDDVDRFKEITDDVFAELLEICTESDSFVAGEGK